jgi:hypothetical protein
MAMKRALLVAALLLLVAAPTTAQNVDPQTILNNLGRDLQRQTEIEQRQRFEDGQRQRALDQQEQAYDRETARSEAAGKDCLPVE